MNDKAKCNNEQCKLKETCARFLTPVGDYQWWSTFQPYLDIDGYWYCEFYEEA